MKSALAPLLVAVSICANPLLAEPPPAPEKSPGKRPLTALETSLVGDWFASGDPDQPAYVASSGSTLFAVGGFGPALELSADADGTLLGKPISAPGAMPPDGFIRAAFSERGLRPREAATGTVKGDVILWSDGTWWSRQPAPEPSVSLTIWNDGSGAWTDLKKLTPTDFEGNDFSKADWKTPHPYQIRGKTYKSSQLLPAHAPTRVTYTFDKPVTEFRAIVGLMDGGRLGSVVFKLKTDAGEVFATDRLTHESGKMETIQAKFAPTKTLSLITDAGENNFEDWSFWIGAEAR